jgi:lysophospholipase
VIRIIKFLLISILLLKASVTFALSEDQYEEKIQTILEPFIKEHRTEGTIQTPDGQTIAYAYYKHPQGSATMVVMQGWTEHYAGAVEFAYDMHQKGISTYFFDWRGQGKSSRPLSDTFRSHILTYDDYFTDLDNFLEQVVKPNRQGLLAAVSFSMGANILALYETRKPKTFDRLILISPMLDIKTGKMPQRMLWAMCKTAEMLGKGSDYIWGSGPFDGKTVNMATKSEIRFEPWRRFRAAHPETVINGVSWSWMRASLEATWKMRGDAEKLEAPMLMLQAGNDSFVNTEGQDYVCNRAKSCLKVVFPQSMHAILAEVDSIRDKALREILDFLEFGA